jgi:hypothetical protein
MLKVTLHAATPRSASARNLLGRLDIGYATLDASADYKAVMLSVGVGEHAPVALKGYPRWSASIWDLVSRVACLSLSHREEVWPAEMPNTRTGAFIENLTALVEHWPDGSDTRRSSVGTAHLAMTSTRCNYRATFTDDILGSETSDVFRHTPKALMPWDLLVRAYAFTSTGSFKLPPRPTLYTPIPLDQAGKSFVCLDTVAEPARTGCYRWLAKRGMKESELPAVDGVTSPCITEEQFVEFLRKAV